jgi:hypothetical protein
VLRLALARSGVWIGQDSGPYAGAWRRVALREAVDNQPAWGDGRSPVYTRSPRSTRGAIRA